MRKKLLSLTLATCLFASMLTGCGSNNNSNSGNNQPASSAEASADSTSDKSTLRINLASEPQYLDPALSSSVDGGCLSVNSFVGLFVTDADNNAVPALCDTYEVSEDQLTYTFTLKNDLKWSDGSELTAADFEYSWKRAADPNTGADYSYLFDVFAKNDDGSIQVTADGNTLTAVLAAPCPYFLDLVAFPTFLPVHQASVEAANPDGKNPGAWASEAGFISNGAYTLESWSHNENMVYVKNPYFYDAENVTVDKLEFMLSADDTAIFAAYNAGNLDFIESVPTDETANLLDNEDFYVADQLGTYFVTFNVNAEIFDGKTVEEAATMRKALSLLIDRDYIIANVAQTGQKLATSFVPEGMADGNGGIFKSEEYTYPDMSSFGYYSAEYDALAAKEQAIELLSSIGYKFDDNGMLSSETPISFVYLINENTGHQAVAESIQQDWASIGIECTIQTEEWSTFTSTRKAGAFTVARDGWVADFNDPINMLEMWTTESGNNNAQLGKEKKVSSAPDWTEYNKLIEDARTCADFAERAQLLHKAEDILMASWAVCPLYYYNDVYMLKSNVSNVIVTLFGMKYFMYANIE